MMSKFPSVSCAAIVAALAAASLSASAGATEPESRRLCGYQCQLTDIVGHADLILQIAGEDPCEVDGVNSISVASTDFDDDGDDDFMVRLQCAADDRTSEFYVFVTTQNVSTLAGAFSGYALRRGGPGHLVLETTEYSLPCAVVWTGTRFEEDEGAVLDDSDDLFGDHGYRGYEAGDFVIQGQLVWHPEPLPNTVPPRPLRY